MPVNVLKDYEPICRYVTQPLVVVVKGDAAYKTIEELIDFGRKNPGKLSFGSPGVGSLGPSAASTSSPRRSSRTSTSPSRGRLRSRRRSWAATLIS